MFLLDIGHHQSSALRVEMRFLSKLPSHHHPTFNYLVGSLCSSYDEVQHNSLKLSHNSLALQPQPRLL